MNPFYVSLVDGTELYLLISALKISFMWKRFASQISILKINVDLNLRNDCKPWLARLFCINLRISMVRSRYHYENMPFQIYWKFYHLKKWKFSDKKFWYFSCFCLKHRLWVLVRTASTRRFSRVPTIYALSKNKKKNIYPCKPQSYYIKVGLRGSKLYRYVFVMSTNISGNYGTSNAGEWQSESFSLRVFFLSLTLRPFGSFSVSVFSNLPCQSPADLHV